MRVVRIASIVAFACSSPAVVEPVVLATPSATVLGLGAGDDRVDWTTLSGTLESVAKTGGAATSVHVTPLVAGTATTVLLDQSLVYTAEFYSGLLRIDPAETATVLDGSVYAAALDHDGYVYWASAGASPGIKRVTGSSPIETLAAGVQAQAIAVDSVGVYWVEGLFPPPICIFCKPCDGAQGPVKMRATSTGAITTVATATPGDWTLAADGDALYVTDSCAGTVTRVSHAGEATTLASGLEGVGSIALDARKAFVIANGRLARVDKVTGAVDFLATGGAIPSALAVDDSSVYFVGRVHGDGSSDRIFALAKPPW